MALISSLHWSLGHQQWRGEAQQLKIYCLPYHITGLLFKEGKKEEDMLFETNLIRLWAQKRRRRNKIKAIFDNFAAISLFKLHSVTIYLLLFYLHTSCFSK